MIVISAFLLMLQCQTRYAVLETYDLVEEVICYGRNGDIDWEASKPNVLDMERYTGSVATTPLRPQVKSILTEAQYKEISQLRAEYLERIKYATPEEVEEETLIYTLLVQDIIAHP